MLYWDIKVSIQKKQVNSMRWIICVWLVSLLVGCTQNIQPEKNKSKISVSKEKPHKMIVDQIGQDQTQENLFPIQQKIYTYEKLNQELHSLSRTYPDFIQVKSLGKTKYGRDIWALKLGKGKPSVLISASHHAREWLTTPLVMKMVDEYAKSYYQNQIFKGYQVKEILDKTSIWFIPMVNPDGVTLQQKGLEAFPKQKHAALIKLNHGSKNFKRWKANAEGIDLNRQYPAKWDSIPPKHSFGKPFYKNHKGPFPLSVIEAKTLVDFTKKINPEIAVDYHSSGQIIYWNSDTKYENIDQAKNIANEFAAITGYPLIPTTWGGGFIDWFVQEYKKPGLTPEIGTYVGETNLPLHIFPEEWERNKTIGLFAATEGYKLYTDFHSKRK